MKQLAEAMFQVVGYVMAFAPVGVGAAVAAALGSKGVKAVIPPMKCAGALHGSVLVFLIVLFIASRIWPRQHRGPSTRPFVGHDEAGESLVGLCSLQAVLLGEDGLLAEKQQSVADVVEGAEGIGAGKTTGGTGANSGTLSYRHDLTRDLTVHLGYVAINNDKNPAYRFGSSGLTGADATTGVPGAGADWPGPGSRRGTSVTARGSPSGGTDQAGRCSSAHDGGRHDRAGSGAVDEAGRGLRDKRPDAARVRHPAWDLVQ